MTEYKRILVISHNCFSKSNSNGRTMANLLQGWPHEKIAQLYIHADAPDFSVCKNYYCVTDGSVAMSILNRKKAGTIVVANESANSLANQDTTKGKSIPRNSLVYLLRNLAWKSQFWNRTGMESWLEDYKPEIVLVQAGDAAFLLDLAVQISKTFLVKLVVYNTEGYYFKKISYLQENIVSRLVYPIMRHSFQKTYERMIQQSKAEVYNCDLLKEDYQKALHTESCVVFNSSEFTDETVYLPKKHKIVYAGNLGLNRHKSLIQFAEKLQRVAPDMVVDVYGALDDADAKSELESCNAIELHGFIPYDELKRILRESQYLLHIESFDEFYKEDLKYAFSTKIADSLAVGTCLFVYAPENMAVIQYLKDKDAAALITDPKMLEGTIRSVLCNPDLSQYYANNSRKLAEQNHNIKKNREKFQKILLE